jgi:hypothetical protein
MKITQTPLFLFKISSKLIIGFFLLLTINSCGPWTEKARIKKSLVNGPPSNSTVSNPDAMRNTLSDKYENSPTDTASTNAWQRKAEAQKEKWRLYSEKLANAKADMNSPFSGRRALKNAILIKNEGDQLLEYEMNLNNLFLDWLLIEKDSLYDIAAIFKTGDYQIDENKIKVNKDISQLVETILSFVKKHNFTKLKGYIICLGFADEQPIETSSRLFNDLCNFDGPYTTDRKELNRRLSVKRSITLGEFIKKQLDLRKNEINNYKPDFLVIRDGRGEELPLKNVKDYQPKDQRRRVVIFHWNILPE